MYGGYRALCIGLVIIAGFTTGCERLKGMVSGFSKKGKPAAKHETSRFSDRERVIAKFGEPKERLGIGKKARSENGIRYNRKWNYYYKSSDSTMPTMRTVYFMDDAVAGSVVRRPDGTVIKEKIKFSY
jgi:hypothetical protein